MKRPLHTILTGLTLLVASQPASGAWLVLCDGNMDAGNRYMMPDGRQRTLLVVDKPMDDCDSVPVDAPGAKVRWSGLVTDEMATRLDRGVSLLGNETAAEIAVSEIIPSRPPAIETARPRPTMRMGVELLPTLEIETFADAERVAADAGPEHIRLSCAPGESVAGASLSAWDERLPTGARVVATIRYSADAEFPVGISDQDDAHRAARADLARLVRRDTDGEISFPLPANYDLNANAFTLLCPEVTAELMIHSIVLRPVAQSHKHDKATWIWAPDRWEKGPQGLIKQLSAAHIATVFVTVPLSGTPLRVANPDRLALFVELATAANITVWAVEGDPAAITVEGQDNFTARARALAKYNESQQNGTRLAGVQYDIEPYLLPGFDMARDAWLAAYIETLNILRDAAAMPMEVAVPFWWSGLALNGRPILDAMTAHVDGITVMNYRTDSEQLRLLSTPYLDWGGRSDRYVRIAIELGPLDDQTLWNFRPNPSGRLWQRKIGDETALILLDLPAPNPFGAAFARAYDVAIPASGTTFFGQRERLAALLPRLSMQWSAWPSYAGVALHEYLSGDSGGALR